MKNKKRILTFLTIASVSLLGACSNTEVKKEVSFKNAQNIDISFFQEEEGKKLELIMHVLDATDKIMIDYASSAQVKENKETTYYEYLLRTEGKEELENLKKSKNILESLTFKESSGEKKLKEELLKINKKEEEMVNVVLNNLYLNEKNLVDIQNEKDIKEVDKKIEDIKNSILTMRESVLALGFSLYSANFKEEEIKEYMEYRQFLTDGNLYISPDYRNFLDRYSMYLENENRTGQEKEEIMQLIKSLEQVQSAINKASLENPHFEKYKKQVKEIDVKEYQTLLEKEITEQKESFITLYNNFEDIERTDFLNDEELNTKRVVSPYLRNIVNFYTFY